MRKALYTAAAIQLAVLLAGGMAATAQTPATSAIPVTIVPQTGQTEIESGAISDSGRLAMTYGSNSLAQDCGVRLWDVATGRMLRKLFQGSACRGDFGKFSISPDDRFAAGFVRSEVGVWSTETGQNILSLPAFAKLKSISDQPVFPGEAGSVLLQTDALRRYSLPDGRVLAAFEDSAAIKDSPLVLSLNRSVVSAVVATPAKTTVQQWRTDTGRKIGSIELPPKAELDHWVLSTDGSRVAVMMADATVRILDRASGAELFRKKLPVKNASEAVLYFAPDDRVLAWFDDAYHYFDFSRQPAEETPGPSFDGDILGISQTGTKAILVKTEKDKAPGIVSDIPPLLSFLDLTSGKVLSTVRGNSQQYDSVSFIDGKDRYLASIADKLFITKADGTTDPLKVDEPLKEYATLALSLDRKALALGSEGGSVSLWNLEPSTRVRTFSGLTDAVSKVELSSDLRLVAAGDNSGAIAAWTAADGKRLVSIKGTGRSIDALAFTPDGRRLIAGTNDNRVRVIDLATGRELQNLRMLVGPVTRLTLSSNGKLVAAGSLPFHVKVWEVESGRLVAKMDAAYGGDRDHFVTAVRFTTKNPQRVWASYGNHLSAFDPTTGKEVLAFEGDASFEDMILSEDEKSLITIATNGTKARWDAATGKLIATTTVFANGEWVTITPEGFFDASPHGAEQLTVVRGLDVYSIDQVYQQLYRPDLVREKIAGDPKGAVREAAAKLDLTKVIETGQAPKATFLSPTNGVTVNAATVTVEARVADQGGGIGKVEWRVNGRTMGVDAGRGVGRPDVPAAGGSQVAVNGGDVTIRRDFDLLPGANRIELIAYNGKDLVASMPSVVTVTREGGTPSSAKPKLYVLSVGINDYFDGALQLRYARPDATAIGQALQGASSGLYSGIEVVQVLDADATAARIDAVFTDLSKRIRPEDVFVFYLAGHGKTEDARFYFLPYDFRYQGPDSLSKQGISQDRFQAWLATVRAQKTILIYDACESGTATRGDAIEQQAALDKLTRATGRTVISAASETQPALEGYRGHGVFTYALLSAFGAADSNGDGLIGVNELLAYVELRVPEISQAVFQRRQFPMKNNVGMDFPLTGKMAVLTDDQGPAISTRPTHVVVLAADALAEAGKGAALQKLAVGTTVTVVKTEQGWMLVAREGKAIGYVRESALLQMR